MKYILTNRTKISNKIINKIIQFCCPNKLDKFKVIVKYEKDAQNVFHGFAYKDLNKIEIFVNKRISFPTPCTSKTLNKYGYLDNSRIKNKKELLVSIIAHELRHLWQEKISMQTFTNTKVHIYDYFDKTFTAFYKEEKDASLYSRKMVLKWRKLKQK